MQRVILVEDNDDLRRGLAEYLSLCNFVVDEAATAAAFYQSLRAHSYDVVILDVNLPDASGFDLARFMAAQRDTGVIVLTARGARQDRVRGYETGADIYLTKPVDSEELALAAWNLGNRVRRERASGARPVARLPAASEKTLPVLPVALPVGLPVMPPAPAPAQQAGRRERPAAASVLAAPDRGWQ